MSSWLWCTPYSCSHRSPHKPSIWSPLIGGGKRVEFVFLQEWAILIATDKRAKDEGLTLAELGLLPLCLLGASITGVPGPAGLPGLKGEKGLPGTVTGAPGKSGPKGQKGGRGKWAQVSLGEAEWALVEEPGLLFIKAMWLMTCLHISGNLRIQQRLAAEKETIGYVHDFPVKECQEAGCQVPCSLQIPLLTARPFLLAWSEPAFNSPKGQGLST